MRAAVVLAVLFAAAPARESIELARLRLLHEALTQAESPRRDWDPGQRDCAGFIRFLYRKALGRSAPLWRDREGSAAAFASAEDLIGYNFSPVARDPVPDRIETGDVLAFYNPDRAPADAWHLMMLLKPPGGVAERVLAVYHNGGAGADAAVRKVWLADLLAGPPEWRPTSSNPRFLGTFRFKEWARPAAQGASR